MQVVDAQRMLDEDGTLMRVKPEKCHVSLPKVYAPDEQIKQVYMFWKSISSYNHAWLQRLRVVRYHQHSGWELEFNGNIKLKLGFVALSKRLQRFLLVAINGILMLMRRIKCLIFDIRTLSVTRKIVVDMLSS